MFNLPNISDLSINEGSVSKGKTRFNFYRIKNYFKLIPRDNW